jgi:hypothetical protein
MFVVFMLQSHLFLFYFEINLIGDVCWFTVIVVGRKLKNLQGN